MIRIVVDPAPASTGRSSQQDRQPALILKMDSLVDAGLEARITSHFQQLVTQMDQLQKDVDELKCALASTVEGWWPEETGLIPTPTRTGVCTPFNPSQSPAVDFSRPGH